MSSEAPGHRVVAAMAPLARKPEGEQAEPDPSLGRDFRFHGAWLDAGTEFYYLRARYYDPRLGRFLSRDPLGVVVQRSESTPGLGVDPLAEGLEYTDPSRILTDGEWIWPDDLAYYVEKYHVSLEREFLNRVRENLYRVPLLRKLDILRVLKVS